MHLYHVFLLTTLLLGHIVIDTERAKLSSFYPYSASSRHITKYYKTLKKNYSQEYASTLSALCTGEKKWLSRQIKKSYKSLALMHLLTPSGIHLGAALFPLRFLSPLLPRFSFSFITLLIYIILMQIPSFFALKRVALYTGLKSTRWFSSSLLLFYFVFFIEIINGHYQQSPLSFLYSYLFWGTILCSQKQSASIIATRLFVSLLLVNSLLATKTSWLSLLVNTPLSALVALFFPFLLFTYFTNISWGHFIASYLIQYLNSAITFLEKVAHSFPSINPDDVTILIGLYFLVTIKLSIRKPLLIFMLLISYAPGLNNNTSQIKYSKRKYQYAIPMQKIGLYSYENEYIKCEVKTKKDGDMPHPYCRKKRYSKLSGRY